MRQPKIACIGATNVDIKARALVEPTLETSNPVTTKLVSGGVARNIAENLARLEVPVCLVSRVGVDDKGNYLIRDLESLYIDTSRISYSTLYATASYTALLKPQGELVIAMADMQIYEEITPSVLQAHIPFLQGVPYWIIDSNLSEESLQYMAYHAKSSQLWAIPVSTHKVKKLKSIFSKLTGIILNVEELAEVVGKSIKNLSMIQHSCHDLRVMGINTIIVTRGKDGVYLDSECGTGSFDALEVDAIDVTGAGDAFAAGVLFGLQSHLSVFEAIPYGLTLASLTLKTDSSVNRHLSLNLMKTEIQNRQNAQGKCDGF